MKDTNNKSFTHIVFPQIIYLFKRYGWHGDKDEFLQRTFDFAIPSYPWIDKYRDKAVTELEFLHGHLNDPGAIPACFFFRDKVWCFHNFCHS